MMDRKPLERFYAPVTNVWARQYVLACKLMMFLAGSSPSEIENEREWQ